MSSNPFADLEIPDAKTAEASEASRDKTTIGSIASRVQSVGSAASTRVTGPITHATLATAAAPSSSPTSSGAYTTNATLIATAAPQSSTLLHPLPSDTQGLYDTLNIRPIYSAATGGLQPSPPVSSTTPSNTTSSTAAAAFSGVAKSPDASTPKAGTILVGEKQRGNPLLRHIRHVWWEFRAITPDFIVGKAACVLYLSLRYHALHPQYIFKRMRELKSEFRLRVVLVQLDVEDVEKLLLDVGRTAVLSDFTVVCASSLAEAARYLETYKAYENKPATAIKERVDDAYLPKVTELLTSIRSINKTDVLTLLSQFGTMAGIMTASLEQIAMCPGFGEKKAKRVYDCFHIPLAVTSTTQTAGAAATELRQGTMIAVGDDADSDVDSVIEFDPSTTMAGVPAAGTTAKEVV